MVIYQRQPTWVQLFPNHDHRRGREVAHVVMRTFAVLYNQLSTQCALENVKGKHQGYELRFIFLRTL